MRNPRHFATLGRFTILAVLVALVACAAPDPAAQRRAYDIALNGWAATERTPAEPEVVADVEAAADPAAEVTPAEGAETIEPMMPTTVVADVQLSILVTNNGGELEQLTVDISHADAAGAEKASYRRTLEVGQIVRGLTNDITVVLEGIELGARSENGAYPDQFAVSLRQDVPAAEHADYPELSGGGH